MTTTTIYASTPLSDFLVSSDASSYPTAYGGGAAVAGPFGTNINYAGQSGDGSFSKTYDCMQSFLAFDTSAIGSDVISSAVLSLYFTGGSPGQAHTLQARSFDFGIAVAAGDFRTPTQFNALTRLADLASSVYDGVAGYADMVEVSNNLKSAPNMGTGLVYVVLSTDRYAAATGPALSEYGAFYGPVVGGTSFDPKLTIVHAPAPVASAPFDGPRRLYTQIMSRYNEVRY